MDKRIEVSIITVLIIIGALYVNNLVQHTSDNIIVGENQINVGTPFEEDTIIEPTQVQDLETNNTEIIITGQKEVHVSIEKFHFIPPEIRISRGTKVVWENNDNSMHRITATNILINGLLHREFISGPIGKKETYEFVFENPGAFPYNDITFFKTMKGIILVE
jgi:plastocyanin